ncbi:glycosyltransferase [Saccharomonospora sp. NPDC046836]|uniref:glycosyltransferase n=1 Tax=Saccharomonospora sp. NPDC046836 TaxID=3156921 RepID=UPI0033E8F73F
MRIKGSWLVATIMGLVLVGMLIVAGWSSAEVANEASARDLVAADQVPGSVHGGGSIVDTTADEVVSREIPDRTIVLTFDDGPDPEWTPRILEVLRKHDVPGTFFVLGAMAARHPDLIRQIRDAGSELGVHTYTHPDLAHVPQWRLERELDQSQLALIGAAGITSRLFRPPFSSSAAALDNPGYGVVEAVGDRGYVSVFTDADSDDWHKPGVDAIVRNSVPANGAGGTVLMHDSGGDRSQTVAALEVLIPRLQAQGYRFTTVSGALELPPSNPPAPATDRLPGTLLVAVVGVSMTIVTGLKMLLVVVGVLTALRLLIMVIAARGHARQRRSKDWSWGPPVTEPVTVIVPAYNEAANIETTVRSAVASTQRVEVIVVDDGSTDDTAEIVERLGLPQVRVIRQPNAGKAAALNTGIAHANNELIVMVDGDTMLEPDTVRELVQPFADPQVGAVAGNVKIANRDTFLTRLQHIEYVIGFNVDRRVHDRTQSMATIPGAGGAFRRRVLIEVGGLSSETLAEDTDLTLAIGRAGWRIVYQDTAVTWTEAPATARQLWQQRYRWTFGTMQAIWKHRRAIFQRGASGRIGRFGLLHVISFQIVLPLSAPVIDVFLIYGLVFLDPATTILLWLVMLVIQLVGGACAFHLDGERKGALWLLPAQQLVYRQLMYVVLLQSVTVALSGMRIRWQRMRRVGVLRNRRLPASRTEARDERTERTGTATHAEPEELAPVAQAAYAEPEQSPVDAADPSARRGPRHAARRTVAAVAAPVRERWLDVLRMAALVRVVIYHTTGWGWLSLAFPAMGVMFALGGSLTARSMGTSPAVDVMGRRIRRLLPPLWLLAVIMVPLMLLHGWNTIATDEHDRYVLNVPDLMFWIFPILDPPANDWGIGQNAAVVLWYLRAYIWFVLLTPLLLRAYNRRPVLTVLAPLALLAVDALLGARLGSGGPFSHGVQDFLTYGACWVLGFAHRDGRLRQLHPAVLFAAAGTAIGVGVAWLLQDPVGRVSLDINDVSLAQGLISTGAVLLLLRVSPSLDWLDRRAALGWLVTLFNARAITIYLWHNIAIDVAIPVMGWLGVPYSTGAHLTVVAVLVGLAVVAFGWAEDIAAKRRIRLLPGRVRTRAPAVERVPA